MEDDIRSVLGLQGYEVVGVRHGVEGEEVEVELPREGCCPRCERVTARVHQRAKRQSRVEFGFVGQKQLRILVQRRRLWCKSCGRAFTQALPGVGKHQRMSTMAQVTVLGVLAEQSFAGLRRGWGISYGRARRILLRLQVPWCDWGQLVGEAGPVHLGIDEHSYRGRDLLITLTCLSTRTPIAILPDDRQASLKAALEAIPPEVQERIEAVCIDGKEGFRSVAKAVLPQAGVVLDHFHLIQDANRRLDETRRLEQGEAKVTLPRWPLLKAQEQLTPKQAAQLALLQERFPVIAEQHWVKEQLRQLYHCPTPQQAEAHLQRILLGCEAADDLQTVLWGKSLRHWRKEILAYFRIPITNAYTEGCHTKIKLLKRLGYGYRNVQIYIRKMLLAFLPRSFDALAPHLLT